MSTTPLPNANHNLLHGFVLGRLCPVFYGNRLIALSDKWYAELRDKSTPFMWPPWPCRLGRAAASWTPRFAREREPWSTIQSDSLSLPMSRHDQTSGHRLVGSVHQIPQPRKGVDWPAARHRQVAVAHPQGAHHRWRARGSHSGPPPWRPRATVCPHHAA